MRLYPPAWLTSRAPTEDARFGDQTIAAGAYVFICPYVTHRHPDYWQNPEGFDPDRFTPERSEGRPRFAYVPFGGGPHQCIGSNFAMLEGMLLLATLSQRARLDLAPGVTVEPEATVTLRPRGGLPMHVRHR